MMSEAAEDTHRAAAAGKAILDGRDPSEDFASVMVTLEHAVAAVLILLMRDPQKAARMLNEGLMQGVEQRLALYAERNRP